MRDQYLDEIVERFEGRFPQFDHSTMQMVAALSNTYHILMAIMERAVAHYGITPQAMDVLIALYVKQENGGCLLGELADLLMVSPANITGLVQGLVKKGLVTRKELATDRRKRLARITGQGIEIVEDVIPASVQFFEEAFASLSTDDEQRLSQGLRQIASLLMPYWDKRLSPRFGPPESDANQNSESE